MAFPETPLGLRGELMLGGSWVDITKDIYTREPIRIVHGTANEGAQPDPASCALLLNNAGGKYSPRNPLGENFGRLLRNAQLWITVPAEESWLRLDGGHASTPHSATLATPGDLDLRAEVTPDDWVVYGRAWPLITRWNGDVVGYALTALMDGTLELAWSPTGTRAGLRAVRSTAQVDGRGGRLCIRAVLDVDNGTAGCTVTFYSGPTVAGPWTVIGSPVVSAGTTSVANPATPLVLGTMLGLPYPGIAMAGRLHRAEVRSGIDGAVIAAPDFTGLDDGAAGVTDAAGRVWSLTGAAVVSRREPLFVGEVPDFPARWTGSGEDAYVPIQAAGILRRLGQGRRPLESTLRRRIPSDRHLIAYWPMEDGDRAAAAYSPLEGVQPLALSGFDYAADDSLGGSAPLPRAGESAALRGSVPRSSAVGWQVESVFFLPSMPTAETEILRIAVAGSAMRTATVYASTAGVRIEARDSAGEVLRFFLFSEPAALADFWGKWNRLSIYTADDAGVTRLYVRWRNIVETGWWTVRTGVISGAQGAVTGVSGAWGPSTSGMVLGHLAVFDVPATSSSLSAPPGSLIYDGADDGFDRESALDRIRRLSAEEPVLLLAARDGDTRTGSERMGPQGRAELLTLLGEIVDTDGGILAETMDRLGLVYRDRATLYNQEPTMVLDYAAGQVAPPLEPAEDDADRPNDVTVTRSGGSSARVVVEEGPNSARPPEEGGIGAYEEAVTLSLGSDDQARPIAGWRAHLGTWDEARYPTVRVELHRRPELIPNVLRLRVGDLVRITNPPMYTGPGPLDLIVRQIQHEPRPRAWVLTLGCTPAGPYGVGVVGDAVRGRVDTSGSELVADATASATTLSIGVTAGRPWVSDQREYPVDLAVGGEVVTAVGIGAVLHSNALLLDGLAGWSALSSTIALDTDLVHAGLDASASIRVTPTGASSASLLATDHSPVGTVTPGASYTMSAWVYTPGGWSDMRILADWYSAADAMLSSSPSVAIPVPAGVWTYITLTATAPASASRAGLRARIGASPTAGDLSYWWALRMVPDASVTTTSPQTMTVIRARNGISKSHSAGTDVRLAHPTIVAL